MPATFEPIATTTLGSAASTITFSSIPGTYTDLRLVWVGKTTDNFTEVFVRFNSNSTGYSQTELSGDGSVAASSRQTNDSKLSPLGGDGASSTVPFLFSVDVFSYPGSTNKTSLMTASTDKNGSGKVIRTVGLWANTSAITSIVLTANASTFTTGTTATLYGILKA